MDNLIPLILFALIGGLIRLAKEWAARKEASGGSAGGNSEADRIRRFKEALGLPDDEAPSLGSPPPPSTPLPKEGVPPLMAPKAPPRSPMDPFGKPWETRRPTPSRTETYEERMEERRRRLAELKREQPQARQAAPPLPPAPIAPLAPPAPPAPSATQAAPLSPEPLFEPLAPQPAEPLSSIAPPSGSRATAQDENRGTSVIKAPPSPYAPASQPVAMPERKSVGVPVAVSPHRDLRTQLRTPEQLRKAFVMKEILGPPKALGHLLTRGI